MLPDPTEKTTVDANDVVKQNAVNSKFLQWLSNRLPALVLMFLWPHILPILLTTYRRLSILFARQSDVEFQRLNCLDPLVKERISRRVHHNNVRLGLFLRFSIVWPIILQNIGRAIGTIITPSACLLTPKIAKLFYTMPLSLWSRPFLLYYVVSLFALVYLQRTTVDFLRRVFSRHETIQDKITGIVYSTFALIAGSSVYFLRHVHIQNRLSVFAVQCSFMALWGFWIAWYLQQALVNIGIRVMDGAAQYIGCYTPDLLLARSLQAILYATEKNAKRWGSLESARQLCSQLEGCAKLIEFGFPKYLGPDDAILLRLYIDKTRRMASGLRETKFWTLIPKSDTREQFLARITSDYICAVTGEWDKFASGEPQSPIRLNGRILHIANCLRQLFAILLPPVSCWIFHMIKPKIEIPSYIIAPAIMWTSGGLLYLIDPNLNQKLTVIKDISQLISVPSKDKPSATPSAQDNKK
jgi:hypothetical protein